ncbi:MAG: energy transducer TonB [Colwellia sp.]|nr:energy transducer TonB [Colwellia sp.]
MKIFIALAISLLIHLYFLSIEEVHQPVLISGAAQANVIGLNIVQTPQKVQVKQKITEPVVVEKTINSTQFKGKELLAKQAKELVKPAEFDKEPTPVEVIKKQLDPELTEPVEHIAEVDTQVNSVASASKVTDKSGLKDTPVVLEHPPLFKKPRPPLDYPNKARKRGYQGITHVLISLDAAGSVETVILVRSSGHKILDRAALKNVAKWQFHPVKHNGQLVKAQFEVPINFALNS